MKRILFTAIMSVVVMTTVSNLSAQTTSSGGMTVTATIDPSISLTFASDASGLALSAGGGTGTATMALGHVAAYGYAPPTGVTQVVNGAGTSATAFSVATPFDILVMEANTSSANYTLTAALNSADATNTWKIDTITVTNGSAATITGTGTYDAAHSHTLLISIPFANTAGTISNAINFVATAN